MLIALLVPLFLAGIVCMAMLLRAVFRQRAVPRIEAVVLGAVVSFFDTLGIGSFAPTTAWFKFRKLVPDRLIPQTMLVYDQLALGLVARGRIQTYWFALLSYLIPWSVALSPLAPVDATKGESFKFLAHVITLGFYLPCLFLVLRRPNENPSPLFVVT